MVVLAVDMPLVTTATVRRLMLSAEEDGALLVDDDGRRQYLCAVYRADGADRGRSVATSEQHGLPMRSLVAGLRLAEVPALAWEARDVDTWDDLHRAARAARRLIRDDRKTFGIRVASRPAPAQDCEA